MKNLFKLIGIIALVAIIGVSFATCGDDDGGGGGEAVSGNTITSGAAVVYHSSIKNIAEAKKATDFGFTEMDSRVGNVPLSYYLDDSTSVTIENNKVKIIFGTPKSEFLDNMDEWWPEDGITISPSNGKVFSCNYFGTSDEKYILVCTNNIDGQAFLYYVDSDVTIKGSKISDDQEDITGNKITVTEIYNVSLKKGWNYWIMSGNEKTYTITYTASTTQPRGFKWTVIDENFWNRW